MPHLPSRTLPAMLAGLAVLLAGCAGFSPDGGMGAVQDIAGAELGKDVLALRTPDDADVAHATVRRLLKRPLTADAAVQIALLNNRDLQAAYSSLGISEAALVKASLPPNPTFSRLRHRRRRGIRVRARGRGEHSCVGDAAGPH